MQLAKKITRFRPGCRCGHALSAAPFPSFSSCSRRIQYRELPHAMQAGAFFKSLEFFSLFTIFMHPRHQTPVKTTSENASLIQKIISALIFAADCVVGVIQISRKGANSKSAGPDFTSEDLGKAIPYPTKIAEGDLNASAVSS